MSQQDLYDEYHRSRGDERLELFELLCVEFGVTVGLYPGCFVHVTPAFVIPDMVYVDSDRRAQRFFRSGRAAAEVDSNKAHQDEPQLRFIHSDYATELGLAEQPFDLLVSQYAGFVSARCVRYLKPGGYLVANNSHGDAGLAHCDQSLEFVAAISRHGERFRMSTNGLDEYFIPKKAHLPTDTQELRLYLLSLGRGVGYTKSAADYVFRRTQ